MNVDSYQQLNLQGNDNQEYGFIDEYSSINICLF